MTERPDGARPSALAIEAAARAFDWQQVVLNGGPPCFWLDETGHFCGRAQRWSGHDEVAGICSMHAFVPLVELVRVSGPSGADMGVVGASTGDAEGQRTGKSRGEDALHQPPTDYLPPPSGADGAPVHYAESGRWRFGGPYPCGRVEPDGAAHCSTVLTMVECAACKRIVELMEDLATSETEAKRNWQLYFDAKNPPLAKGADADRAFRGEKGSERMSREVAWLIERGAPEHQAPTVWAMLGPPVEWTANANHASRFTTKEAAEQAIEERSGITGVHRPFGRATEHVWLLGKHSRGHHKLPASLRRKRS